MPPDPWTLYALMLKSRLFEGAVARLWQEGLISGEMHLGTGEEAIMAGILPQLLEGDALALDHRATSALLMRGVDPVLILRELLGLPDGLCGGMGGHMHLFSREHLAASSGIVGATGPAAVGFALSAQLLRPGHIAVAFFGEGAMNQGMLMESLNLAAAWKLPVLFVCKDDGWAITTQPGSATRGGLSERARSLGVPALEVDGLDASAVWEGAAPAIETARSGGGPAFLHARCVHLDAHFLGFELTRTVSEPLKGLSEMAGPLGAFLHPGGAGLRERVEGLKMIFGAARAAARDPRRDPANDPLRRARQGLLSDPARLQELEDGIQQELSQILSRSTQSAGAGAAALEEVPA